jgi:hypothetical protein
MPVRRQKGKKKSRKHDLEIFGLAILEPVEHQHPLMSSRSLPPATELTSTSTTISHNKLHFALLAPDGMYLQPPPLSLSAGDVDTASPSAPTITPPNINSVLTSGLKKNFLSRRTISLRLHRRLWPASLPNESARPIEPEDVEAPLMSVVAAGVTTTTR